MWKIKKLIKKCKKNLKEKLGHEILDRMNKSHETMARWVSVILTLMKQIKS